jgi:flagellar protein FliS
MFANTYANPRSRNASFGMMYRDIGMETALTDAGPHRLVAMLFDGWMEAVARARGALQSGDRAAKAQAIRHAARIVEEGLRANLNIKAGGKLARDLNDLYAHVALQLTIANVRNDAAVLDHCVALMKPIQEAWAAIGNTPAAKN